MEMVVLSVNGHILTPFPAAICTVPKESDPLGIQLFYGHAQNLGNAVKLYIGYGALLVFDS